MAIGGSGCCCGMLCCGVWGVWGRGTPTMARGAKGLAFGLNSLASGLSLKLCFFSPSSCCAGDDALGELEEVVLFSEEELLLVLLLLLLLLLEGAEKVLGEGSAGPEMTVTGSLPGGTCPAPLSTIGGPCNRCWGWYPEDGPLGAINGGCCCCSC